MSFLGLLLLAYCASGRVFEHMLLRALGRSRGRPASPSFATTWIARLFPGWFALVWLLVAPVFNVAGVEHVSHAFYGVSAAVLGASVYMSVVLAVELGSVRMALAPLLAAITSAAVACAALLPIWDAPAYIITGAPGALIVAAAGVLALAAWHACVALFLTSWAHAAAKSHTPCCIDCGYDLRALPSNTCPECGAPFGSPRAPAPDPTAPAL